MTGNGRGGLRWAAPALALALVAIWELVGRLGWVPTLFLPPPSLVFATLREMTTNGELPLHLGATLSRMGVALAWGGGIGLGLGLVLGYSPRLRAVFDPFIAALHPVPRMALLPLILLLFGISFFSKALVVAISTFFPMVINSMAGVQQVDPNYYDVAKIYGATRARIFWRVVLPASLPMILAGLRLALTRALAATVALELITAQSGLGSMLFFAWQTYRSEELFATLVVIAVLGFGFRSVVDKTSAHLLPWLADTGRR